MKRLLLLFLALALGAPAWAQPINQYVAVGAFPFIPTGFCQLSAGAVARKVSAACGSIPAGSTIAQVCVETAPIRYRDDGPSPTVLVGIPVSAGTTPNCFTYSAVSPGTQPGAFMGDFTVIEGVAGTSAGVDINFYNGGK